MADTIDTLIERIRELEDRLDAEFDRQRELLGYHLERGKTIFETEIIERHKAFRTTALRYLAGANPLVILTAPVIYAVVIPLFLLDIFVTIYQAVCFPIYRIKKVPRSEYIIFDRHRLQYLNAIQKFNCLYCSYANGLIAYVREIAARTEKHWCPIKHARRIRGAHNHYYNFSDYGDPDVLKVFDRKKNKD